MTLEEQLIHDFGKKRPFKVPENYFKNFAAGFMDKLPEREARIVKMSVWKRYRTMVAAAACFIGVAFMSGAYLYQHTSQQQENNLLMAQPASSVKSASSFDQAADYMMIDSDDMYSYLAEY